MNKCPHCAAEELINSYGGLPEAKAYMRRYFKLNGGLRNKYPKTGTLITNKMNELQSAIFTVEGGNNGQ
ncbi:hypothetical protein NRA54_05435 [Acinetobacter baumannii]|nr:hypothetical protein [Acinetobacter baumannii]